MARKIFYFICILSIAVFMLCSCGEKESGNSSASMDETADTPEIMTKIEEIGETEPTASPEPKKINKWLSFAETDTSEDRNPVRVGDGGGFSSIGLKFTVDFIMTDLSLECPSWSDDIGKMVFRLYKWDTDYALTTAGEPIFTDTDTFVDYPDNATMEIIFDPEIGPGTYLWELSEGTGGVGVWAFKTHGAENLEFYKKGELYTDNTAFNGEINGYIMFE